SSPEKIGEGIREATARGESPRVLLYLDLPPVSPADLPRLKREVAGVQDRVLGRLDHREFVLERRFAAIPVLAGRLAAPGLDRLSGISEVLQVELDPPVQADLLQSVPLIRADIPTLGWTGQGVKVAIIDTGVDTDHPDLSDDLDSQAC